MFSCRLAVGGLETGQSSNIQLLKITASRQGCQGARLQVTDNWNKALELDIQSAYLSAGACHRLVLTQEVDMGTAPYGIVTRIHLRAPGLVLVNCLLSAGAVLRFFQAPGARAITVAWTVGSWRGSGQEVCAVQAWL